MAVLQIPDQHRSLREHVEVRDYLAGIGIDFERWPGPANLPSDASADEVLAAYRPQIEELKRRGKTLLYTTHYMPCSRSSISSIATMRTKYATSSPAADFSISTRNRARLSRLRSKPAT